MKSLFVAALLAACAIPAHAEILPLQQQYGAPVGFSSQWSAGQNTGGCLSPGQCFTVAAGQRLLGCAGTSTIKAPNLELLFSIIMGTPGSVGVPVWTGHQMTDSQMTKSTIVFRTPPMPNNVADNTYLMGDGANIKIWVEYQIINNGNTPTPPGGAWEIQAPCTFTFP